MRFIDLEADRRRELEEARQARRTDSTQCLKGRRHRWVPLDFRFESQLLDSEGRVLIRQPDIHEARVYYVCHGCSGYTYRAFEWVGYYLGGPGDNQPVPKDDPGEDV